MFRSQKEKRKKEEQDVLMRRRASMLDRYQKVFDKLEENRDDFEDNFERMTTNSAQQDQELTKVVDAIKSAQNTNNCITKTLQDILSVMERQAKLFDEQAGKGKGGLDEGQLNELRRIVERSQQVDSPQRELLTLDRKYEDTYQDMSDLMKTIERLDDQMSVNSLNAAVEAGKVGPRGRKLIKASEDVRSLAEDYNEATKDMMEIFESFSELMDETRERVDQLAACVQEQTSLMERFLNQQEDAAEDTDAFGYAFATSDDFEESYAEDNTEDFEDEYAKHYGNDDFEDEYAKHYGSEDEDEASEDVEELEEPASEPEDTDDVEELEELDGDDEDMDDETMDAQNVEENPQEQGDEEETAENDEEILIDFNVNGDIHDAIEGLQEVLNVGKKTAEHHREAVQQMVSAGATFMDQQKVMQRLENLYETVADSIHQVYKEVQDDAGEEA